MMGRPYRHTDRRTDARQFHRPPLRIQCELETDRDSVSDAVFRPKLDHVETETSRNWISSKQTVVGNDLPANNYLVRQDKSTRTDEAI